MSGYDVVRLSVRVSKREHAALIAEATDQNISLNYLIRILIRQAFKLDRKLPVTTDTSTVDR